MSEEQALIIVEKLNPVEIFQNGGMDKILKEIESKVKGLVFDVSTEDGRKDCISTAYRVTRCKTLLDNLGKDHGADLKKQLDAINADRKKARDTLGALADNVREPVTEWEAEQERIKKEEEERERQKCQARLDELLKYGKAMSFFDAAALTDDEYSAILEQARADHAAEQKRLEDERLTREAEAKKLAEERAEFEKLRAEQAERDRIEREKQEAERRKLEDERKAIEAEKARIAHEEAVKKAAEEARIKAKQEAEERAEREAREKEEREETEVAEKARQEALRPLKEKLVAYADALLAVSSPVIKSDDQAACDLMDWAWAELLKLTDGIKQRANDL